MQAYKGINPSPLIELNPKIIHNNPTANNILPIKSILTFLLLGNLL